MATMVDPARPDTPIQVNIKDRKPVNELTFAWGNYTDLFAKFSFGRYLWNSVFITVVATLLTLLIKGAQQRWAGVQLHQCWGDR